ncbi:hypothetical protein SAMN05442782_1786 [Streptomyces sp. OK228]|nr:hypothetical protein SAMN05442782_1786 [Streptomyces sp. OK228]
MNCPNCGAGSYQGNRGRWICSNHCGWETEISPGLGGRYELSELWRSNLAGTQRRLVVWQLRMADRVHARPRVVSAHEAGMATGRRAEH